MKRIESSDTLLFMWWPIRYRASVFARAWKDTVAHFGWKWKALWNGLITLPIGAAVFYFSDSSGDARAAIIVWSARFVIPVLGTGGVVFLWNLFLAPAAMSWEQSETIKTLSEQVEGFQPGDEQRAVLEIRYDPNSNLTEHPNGDCDARIIIHNSSSRFSAKRVRLKIGSLIPLSNKAKLSQFSTQFSALRLPVVREKPGFSLHAGDVAEAIIVQSEAGTEFFYIRGYRADAPDELQSFRTPCGRYELTLIATAENAVPSAKSFILFPRKNGRLSFRMKTPAD